MNYKENGQIEISLHYYLSDAKRHQVDAFIRNKCEKQLLMALQRLVSFFSDYPYPIDVRVHKEGGLIDDYIIQLFNWLSDVNTQDVLKTLLTIFGTYYFTKKINIVADIKNRLEALDQIKSRLKEGSINESEVMTLISSDRKLKKIMQDFFRTLKSEERVTSIGFTHCIPSQKPDSHFLERTDFDKYFSDGPRQISYYLVNGEEYRSMRAAVKRCFEIFIDNNPAMTAEDIINAWLSLGINVPNLIEDETTFARRASRTKDPYSDKLILKNGEHIYTSNHYNSERFYSFMEKVNAQNWGIHIDISE